MQNDAPDKANVIALPPLIYAAACIIGWLIHLAFPIPVLPVKPARVIGVLLVLASFPIAITALRALRRAQTTFDTTKPTTAIVTEGPYRYRVNCQCGRIILVRPSIFMACPAELVSYSLSRFVSIILTPDKPNA